VLSRLRLENFRGFSDHEIPFTSLTILVGRNNAGKSTVVEGLRLISLILARAQTRGARFLPAPGWLTGDPRAFWGPAPAAPRDLDFHPQAFFHRYGNAPAVVTADFRSGSSVAAFVGPEGQLHGVLWDSKGNAVTSASEARALRLPEVRVQPQVSPLPRTDAILAPLTVERGLGTSLSPLHFRNQLNLFYRESFPRFKDLAEATWPYLQITDLQGRGGVRQTPLELLVREGDFVAEIGLMGHGLQMWLQMIWFLAQCPQSASVMLDEPDVYMHPDLQHRLLDHIEGEYEQVVITTHSTEIVATVDPESLVAVDRSEPQSRAVSSFPGAQEVIWELGGVYNLDVARLYSARSFLMVEGRDTGLLRAFQRALSPQSRDPINTIPKYETGGWGGWNRAVLDKVPRRNGQGRKLAVFALFDSDYHTDREIGDRYREAKAAGVSLHIWTRKEIENYVLSPAVIARFIQDRVSAGEVGPDETEVSAKLDEIADALRSSVREAIADHLQQANRGLSVTGALKAADKRLAVDWTRPDTRRSVIPGKAVMAELSKWAEANHGVSVGPIRLARSFRANEVPAEMRQVVQAIGAAKTFPASIAHPASAAS
jgi:hypothetical protein